MSIPPVISLLPSVVIWVPESLEMRVAQAASMAKRAVVELLVWEAGEGGSTIA